jgi:RNA polymerase sigma factor (sigma-70 family)
MPSGADDIDLLLRWRAGDAEAGEELVRRHYRLVYDFLVNKVDADREDLAQKIFLACTEGVARLRDGGSFRAYLLSIARNHVVDYYRGKSRARAFDPGTISIEQVAGSGSASVALAQREQQRSLLLALRRLPFDLQVTLELYYWENLPLGEIAVATDVPVGTVKSRLARARDVLRRELDRLDALPRAEAHTDVDFDGWARALARPDEPMR